MELTEISAHRRNRSVTFIPLYIKQENEDREKDFNDIEIIATTPHFCVAEIKENSALNECNENKESTQNTDRSIENGIITLDSVLHVADQNDTCNINTVLSSSMYLQNLDCENVNVEPEKSSNQMTEVFVDHNIPIQMTSYNISAVTIPSEFLSLNLNIKKEDETNQSPIYTTEWLCNGNSVSDLQSKLSKNIKQVVTGIVEPEVNSNATLVSDIETATKPNVIPIVKQRSLPVESNNHSSNKRNQSPEKRKRRVRVRSTVLQDYKERLRRKAECMREKRKKLYEEESPEQREQRLAKEAAKRREVRMYYETPEQRRKRLDAEAARKREYRMYNETPEDRRKRLDREAERRRRKRLSLYANETPEQRRDRLNKESAKRREARLNQYAKETQEEKKERLRRDALRVREMRFTRSAIETEDERRQRLVKDAIRKREVRKHGSRSLSNSFTELQTVCNFEELNNVKAKENSDNQLEGHYLSNWMMWFQNSLTQPVHVREQIHKCQTQNTE